MLNPNYMAALADLQNIGLGYCTLSLDGSFRGDFRDASLSFTPKYKEYLAGLPKRVIETLMTRFEVKLEATLDKLNDPAVFGLLNAIFSNIGQSTCLEHAVDVYAYLPKDPAQPGNEVALKIAMAKALLIESLELEFTRESFYSTKFVFEALSSLSDSPGVAPDPLITFTKLNQAADANLLKRETAFLAADGLGIGIPKVEITPEGGAQAELAGVTSAKVILDSKYARRYAGLPELLLEATPVERVAAIEIGCDSFSPVGLGECVPSGSSLSKFALDISIPFVDGAGALITAPTTVLTAPQQVSIKTDQFGNYVRRFNIQQADGASFLTISPIGG